MVSYLTFWYNNIISGGGKFEEKCGNNGKAGSGNHGN